MRSRTTRGSIGSGYTSIWPGTSRAPHRSTISCAVSRWAASAFSGCSCFSNRVEASERRFSALEVFRMLVPTNVAASTSTRVVVSETSDTWPPITPPMPVGPSGSVIRHISSVNVRSTSSRVVMVSPSRALRTMIFPPRTLSRSNVWMGCPQVSIT